MTKRLIVTAVLYKKRLIRGGQKQIAKHVMEIPEDELRNLYIMELRGRTLFKQICEVYKNDST